MLLLSGKRPYFSQNSRRGIIDWLLTFGGLLPDGKKKLFLLGLLTRHHLQMPFAPFYIIWYPFPIHAMLLCFMFTILLLFGKAPKTFISVLWQIVDTENQFAMQPAKSQLQPENALFAIVCNRHRSLLLWQTIHLILTFRYIKWRPEDPDTLRQQIVLNLGTSWMERTSWIGRWFEMEDSLNGRLVECVMWVTVPREYHHRWKWSSAIKPQVESISHD